MCVCVCVCVCVWFLNKAPPLCRGKDGPCRQIVGKSVGGSVSDSQETVDVNWLLGSRKKKKTQQDKETSTHKKNRDVKISSIMSGL